MCRVSLKSQVPRRPRGGQDQKEATRATLKGEDRETTTNQQEGRKSRRTKTRGLEAERRGDGEPALERHAVVRSEPALARDPGELLDDVVRHACLDHLGRAPPARGEWPENFVASAMPREQCSTRCSRRCFSRSEPDMKQGRPLRETFLWFEMNGSAR
jgi:hypothetical protein